MENQVKDGSAASIWSQFSVTLYPTVISSTGEKWQGLILFLCQKKSSESEHSLPKRCLVNYNVFSLPWCATSPLLPPPRLSLSMAATSGHALLHGEEARHVWNVYSCRCQDTEGGSLGLCAKLLTTESVPSQGLQMCRLTGSSLMRRLKWTSILFWAISSHSSRQTKPEDKNHLVSMVGNHAAENRAIALVLWCSGDTGIE